jgi:hypothetical protein
MRSFLTLFLAWLSLAAAPALAADRKVALIIANGAYANTSQLANPANDGALVAASARKAGFATVTIVRDLSLTGFQRALRDFRDAAAQADVAMVYYAGHGIEGAGKNWLIPVDAQLKSDLDLPYEAIDLDRVMESISGAKVRMVVLDACRNNPFGRSWKSGTRAVTRGLGGIDVDDVLVIYAAAPGQTASDGTGGNSPFAKSLAVRMVQPDLPIQLLGGAVRDDVLAETGGVQRPFVSASITGTPVYLVPRSPSGGTQTASAGGGSAGKLDEATLDALAWQGALGADSIEGYREYRRAFPNGRFVGLSEQNIVRIQRSAKQASPAGIASTASLPVPSAGPPPPALIFSSSSSRLLTRQDVAPLSAVQLRLARNEIFARHGYVFNSPDLRAYFGRFSWYKPTGGALKLNATEQANITLLQQAEKAVAAKN